MKKSVVMVHTQFNKNIKIVRFDNGTEFIYFKIFLKKKGFYTKHLLLVLRNKMKERDANIAIYLMACALCFQRNLPIKFWGEYVLTAGISSIGLLLTSYELAPWKTSTVITLCHLVAWHTYMIQNYQKINFVIGVGLVFSWGTHTARKDDAL